MNFNDLYKRIASFDKPQGSVSECACNEIDPSKSTQPDSVSINVNINGSGKGGIKDILDVLRNIENTRSSSEVTELPMPFVISTHTGNSEVEKEGLANSPDPKYADSNIISGDDLNKSKKSFSNMPYRGDNPMAIKSRLESLYSKIKSR